MKRKLFFVMIFEDPKQIIFELIDVSKNESGEVVAKEGLLYLENSQRQRQRLIDVPIYTCKALLVAESN